MPKEGSAFHPPIRHSVSPGMGGGLGAPEGEQDSAHGPSSHRPAALLKAVPSPGPQKGELCQVGWWAWRGQNSARLRRGQSQMPYLATVGALPVPFIVFY